MQQKPNFYYHADSLRRIVMPAGPAPECPCPGAGIQVLGKVSNVECKAWIPAFAGMTTWAVPIFLTLVLLAGGVIFAEELDKEYRITDIEGQVAIIPQGAKKASPARKDLVLLAGDQVVTGRSGRAEIAAKEGTVIELKENTGIMVKSLSDQVHIFFLKTGRMLARFRPMKGRKYPPYKVRTPVAVASVRGTELVMDVDDKDELQAGVVEGEVAFEPMTTSTTNPESDWPEEVGVAKSTDLQASAWPEKEVVVKSSEGFIVKPGASPVKMPEIPPLVVDSLVWFQSVKDRIPLLREEWKDLDTPSKQALRKTAFRDTVKWEIPEKFFKDIQTPKQKIQKGAVPKQEIEKQGVESVNPKKPSVPKPK